MSAGASLAPGRHGPAARWSATGWILAAAGLIAAFLIAGLLADALAPTPSGPPSSSYATAPEGTAAWAELLARAGHPVVQLRRPLDGASLATNSTLVVLGADSLRAAAARNIERFVRGGGVLVLQAGRPARLLPALRAGAPGWRARSPRAYAPAAGALPETVGVSSVQSAGGGAWVGGTGERALAARSGPALLLARRLGAGRIDLLADASPVQNRLLGAADNAQLALDLAGGAGRPVVFAEALHGFGAATGLAALPTRVWLLFAGLCLAGIAWAVARGRRLGPPEAPPEPAAPPRAAYVDALGRSLSKAGARALAAPVRAAIASELQARRTRPAAGAPVDPREALSAAGCSPSEAELVLEPGASPDGERELLVLGRVLARLRSRA